MPDPKKKKSILTSSDKNIFNTKPLSEKKRQAFIKEEVGPKPKYKPQLSDMPSPIRKIKEKKTGEIYSSRKAMIKHEKSESKTHKKKEYKKDKKSPLKFAGNMIPGITSSNNDLGIGNTPKNNSITGTVMNSLQKSFYPKSPNATVSKSPFRKTSTTTTKKTK
jgi:hypothetical protein